MTTPLKHLAGVAATAAAALISALPALADGMPRARSAPAAAKEPCTYSANTALATEYIFRGFSQTAGAPAVQGGFDMTCGIFYAGVWGSNLDWGRVGNNANAQDGVAKIEIDWYAGFKPKTGPVTWDLGVIYYTYPNAADQQNNNNLRGDPNYVELKAGASMPLWKDATIGETIFFSPDYSISSGNVWTFETAFTQGLPKVGIFTPSFSATYGFQQGSNDANYRLAFGNTRNHYSYWNAGLTLGFRDKWALDFRYWDTDVSNAGNFCKGDIFQCDQRYVGSLKFTF